MHAPGSAEILIKTMIYAPITRLCAVVILLKMRPGSVDIVTSSNNIVAICQELCFISRTKGIGSKLSQSLLQVLMRPCNSVATMVCSTVGTMARNTVATMSRNTAANMACSTVATVACSTVAISSLLLHDLRTFYLVCCFSAFCSSRMSYLLLIATCLVVATASGKSRTLDRIQVRDKWMVDPSGRVRLFHGFNSVQKGPPWFKGNILNTTQLRLYRDWGFNAVRLGAMWKGIEPSPGEFDSALLSRLQNIVETLEDHGLYVILDMHQDVMSIFNSTNASVGYEGIPRWLIDKFSRPQNPYPWPLKGPPSDSNWAMGYFTEAVSSAFQQLYNDTSGAVGHMSRFWAKVATTFKNQSSVLGYELINEPWAGDIYHFPVLLPGNAGKLNLAPFYDKLNSAIRNVDENTLIFFEPTTWGVFQSHGILGTGFETVPGGAEYRNRSVLSYHYYCWLLYDDPSGHYPFTQRLCDKLLGPQMMRSVVSDVGQIGGSSFLTEFGLCSPDGDPLSTNTVECEFVMSLADKFLQSWTYWDSLFFNGAGEVDWNVVKPFARVYARAIAGIPQNMTFDLETKRFELSYIIDKTIKAPTEVFIPDLHYPKGFHVKTSEQLSWSFDKELKILYVLPSSDDLWDSPYAFICVEP